jgi:hypothetical protein
MKKFRRLAALCAVLALSFCFTTVAHAANGESGAEESTDIVTGGILEPKDTAAFTSYGTGTVVDSAASEDGKQFYTIVTPAGNTFYLIIDLERDSDNVYFLDAVTEKDLLALAKQSGYDTETDTASKAIHGALDDTAKPTSAVTNNNNMGTLLLVLAVVVIGGGAGYYFKIYRPKHQKADSEDDFDYGDESSLDDLEETEPSDELPPWEDEDIEDDEE